MIAQHEHHSATERVVVEFALRPPAQGLLVLRGELVDRGVDLRQRRLVLAEEVAPASGLGDLLEGCGIDLGLAGRVRDTSPSLVY